MSDSAAPAPRPAWRDRLWSFKAMLLVACATLIVGGLTGAALTVLVSGHHHDRFEHDWRMAPYGGPGHGWGRGDRPWEDRHFYWNDGPQPQGPQPGAPTGPPPPPTPESPKK